MPNTSRLPSGAVPFVGFNMEGIVIGGSWVDSKRGSTGAEGCHEAGRGRPEARVSGD